MSFRNPEAYNAASKQHITSLRNYLSLELGKDPEAVSFDACSFTDEGSGLIGSKVYGMGTFYTQHNQWGTKLEHFFNFIN